MAEGTLQILGLGTSAVPLDYQFSGSQTAEFIALKADFDGTSAMVDFVPVVEILSDAGHVMAQSKGPTVAAGGSATVTFFPFSGAESLSTADGFIRFDVNNGQGVDHFLAIFTQNSSGVAFTDTNGLGFSASLNGNANAAGFAFATDSASVKPFDVSAGGPVNIDSGANHAGTAGQRSMNLTADSNFTLSTKEGVFIDTLFDGSTGANIEFTPGTGLFIIDQLPAADPGVSGALYLVGTVVHRSP